MDGNMTGEERLRKKTGETGRNFLAGAGIQSRKAEWAVFVLLAVSFAAAACFHEPWFGEAEAWQIARCASLKEILFYIPHYEGHPPLWHLMAAIPAKLGLPYELSLKIISGAAVLCSGWLILFRSSFPKLIRFTLPFHYFFFYQYGVVSRPYGYVLLCLLLMALTFRDRDRRPWRFFLPMLFLCLFSAYGIVMAGGVCIVWVWEIAREKSWKLFSMDFWRDKRIMWLLTLLAAAILLILDFLPRPDTYTLSGGERSPLLQRLLYVFFVMLPESTVLTILPGEHYLMYYSFSIPGLITGVALGILMVLVITMVSSGKNLRYFVVPYSMFGFFSALVYFNAHHIGLGLAFAIFWLWIALEDPNRFRLWYKISPGLKSSLKISNKDWIALKKLGVLALAALLAVPVFWSIRSTLMDVWYPYSFGRDTAAFIKENGLEELSIMAEWDVDNTNLISLPVSILPYMENMTVWNMRMGDPSKGYVEHRVAGAQENRDNIAKWREHELPEMLIGNVDLDRVYGEGTFGQYVCVYQIRPIYANIWKGILFGKNMMECSFIYLKKDLLDQYGLEPISSTPF